MKKIWMSLLIFSVALSAFASDALVSEAFNKRFKLVRNDEGKLTAVKMRLYSKRFTIAPYLKQIKADLIEQIRLMKSKDVHAQFEIDELLEELESSIEKSTHGDQAENVHVLRRSFANLPVIKVEDTLKKIQLKGVLKRFQTELKKVLKMLDLAIIADPTDTRYFYRKNVTYTVVKEALEFAKKRFDNIPVLNLASFVIVRVHEMILEQRLVYQNMLLHYLQNHETMLGMTTTEVNRVFSSVYESRIPVTGFQESNLAKRTWGKYGLNKFYAVVRMGNNKIRRNRTLVMEKHVNFGFIEVKEEGQRVIKNLINNKHMFSGKMATAYYYDKPNKVRRFRTLLNLGQLGLGFLPIPGWIKSNVESFVESYYVQQKRTEGALIGFFEATGHQAMFEAIIKQNVNPYLKF